MANKNFKFEEGWIMRKYPVVIMAIASIALLLKGK